MPLPIISVAQMRDWEQRTWDAGVVEESVMSNAGQAVAQMALEMTPEGGMILLLAGKGNNGGDTRIAAEHLPGRSREVIDASDPVSGLRDFNRALEQSPDLIVDGLFGIGLDRDLDEDHCELVRAINQTQLPVLAVDAPSGLNADTGQPMGAAIQARCTVTLGLPKVGLLKPSADDFVGTLEVAHRIGLIDDLPASEQLWLRANDLHGMPPARSPSGHKGAFGHVGIIAGSTGYHGAACLCARGALRARPGLVSVFTPAYQAVAAQLQSPMVHPWNTDVSQPLSSCTALVVGPGLAGPDVPESLRNVVRELWRESASPIIADASALDWLTAGEVPENSIRILTPHPGEAARLLDCEPSEIQQDRLAATQKLAENLRATIVLKGRHTMIGQGDGPVLVNSTGNSGLGQGGSGDVLAGFLGGFLAQPQFHDRVIQATAFAVWQHGHAADRLEATGRYWGMDALIDALAGD